MKKEKEKEKLKKDREERKEEKETTKKDRKRVSVYSKIICYRIFIRYSNRLSGSGPLNTNLEFKKKINEFKLYQKYKLIL